MVAGSLSWRATTGQTAWGLCVRDCNKLRQLIVVTHNYKGFHDCVNVANDFIVLILTSANSLHADPYISFTQQRHSCRDCGVIHGDSLQPRWRNIQLCTWRLVSELAINQFKLKFEILSMKLLFSIAGGNKSLIST